MAHHALILAAALALAAPAPASAINSYGTYGGGWAGAPGDVWLAFDVDDSGEAFDVSGRVASPCGLGSIEAGSVPSAAAEPLALDGVTRAGSTETRWRLTGVVGMFEGSGRLEATVSRGGRRCSVAGRSWAVAIAGSDHQGGGRPPAGSRW
ncbi:MAG TPA: hypothetical protein VGW10_00005, partial [Solirubrobacteraceae bacterium]|nr:hypothetical protein [Solirubrobacteraceae bacterium]